MQARLDHPPLWLLTIDGLMLYHYLFDTDREKTLNMEIISRTRFWRIGELKLSQKVKVKKKSIKYFRKGKQLMSLHERMEREVDICERSYSKWMKRNNFNNWMSKHASQVLEWKHFPP